MKNYIALLMRKPAIFLRQTKAAIGKTIRSILDDRRKWWRSKSFFHPSWTGEHDLCVPYLSSGCKFCESNMYPQPSAAKREPHILNLYSLFSPQSYHPFPGCSLSCFPFRSNDSCVGVQGGRSRGDLLNLNLIPCTEKD